jgi:NTP pyrophosphatase (non-canonical NTP hydrolase)
MSDRHSSTPPTATPATSGVTPKPIKKAKPTKRVYYATPFAEYFRQLDEIDKGKRNTDEFGSILILGILEELGEMARAYLAKHGRKQTNLAAQADETYEQELGDILVSILRFARIKKINLNERIKYSLDKVAERRNKPKEK